MAKVYDYHNVAELTSVVVDESNKNMFNQLQHPDKEVYPSAISREEFDNMMDMINIYQANALVHALGFENDEIQIDDGNPEKIQFCHFHDVDNNIDFAFRQKINKQTCDYIYSKICEFKPLETQFRTFFTTLI